MKRRHLAIGVAAFVAAPMVGAPHADAAYWTTEKLARHAASNPFACRVAHHWGPKQNRCIVRVVWRDHPAIGRQAERIISCESGWDEQQVTPPYSATGLAQFLPSTWRAYRWRHKNPKHPVYSVLQMRVVRMIDGDFGQWVCRP